MQSPALTMASLIESSPSALKMACPLHSEPEPRLIWIEVASHFQIPGLQIIGLPAPEIGEAKERIRAAILASNLKFPKRRVVINLAPASVPKHGTGLDLAMALGVLWSAHKDLPTKPTSWAAWGELSLSGDVRPLGQLTRLLYSSWRGGIENILVSSSEFEQAQLRLEFLIRGEFFLDSMPPQLHGVAHLAEAWELLKKGEKSPTQNKSQSHKERSTLPAIPATPASGLLALHPSHSRLLGVSASGAHHLLMLGPKGSGKTQALDWLTSIQPCPSPQTLLQQALLREMTEPYPEIDRSPLRKVSSQIRSSALIGSSQAYGIRPGEFSLAHGGLLIADELPEWGRDARESLREPLESGRVLLTRVKHRADLPARFVLAATGNFCACGGWPSELQRENQSQVPCTCSTLSKKRYLARLSGPVLDRIDLIVFFSNPASSHSTTRGATPITPQELSQRVDFTQKKLISKWGSPSGQIPAPLCEEILSKNRPWSAMPALVRAGSLRSRHKMVRLALTFSAWDELAEPGPAQFEEAYRYRSERLGLT